jgi:hypothetical protein
MSAAPKVSVHAQFPLTSDEIRLLSDLGFMAIQTGHVVPALGIFHALRVLRPQHALPFIGIALSHVARGAVRDAVAVLSEGDAAVTVERDDLRLYQGLVLSLAGDSKASEGILASLAARNSLGEVQRFFLEKMLQKKHLKGLNMARPSPAKVFSKSSEES